MESLTSQINKMVEEMTVSSIPYLGEEIKRIARQIKERSAEVRKLPNRSDLRVLQEIKKNQVLAVGDWVISCAIIPGLLGVVEGVNPEVEKNLVSEEFVLVRWVSLPVADVITHKPRCTHKATLAKIEKPKIDKIYIKEINSLIENLAAKAVSYKIDYLRRRYAKGTKIWTRVNVIRYFDGSPINLGNQVFEILDFIPCYGKICVNAKDSDGCDWNFDLKETFLENPISRENP